MTAITLIAGIALLIVGADLVVRSASAISTRLRVPPVVVGLTVVALATSLPEAVVSVGGVWQGHGELSLGNAVGSNLFNVLFILGLVALLRPLEVNRSFLRRELPVLAVVTAGCLLAGADQALTRGEGVLLIIGLTGYLYLLVRSVNGGRESLASARLNNPTKEHGSKASVALSLVGGFAALGLGAHLALAAAIEVAAAYAVSERIVGLFVLGAGSSLPELVTSVVAVRRGAADLAIGNVLGSCLFNLLFVLGITGVLAPASIALSTSALVDLTTMAAAFVLAAWFLRTGLRLSRREGAVLVVNYLIYCGVALSLGDFAAS